MVDAVLIHYLVRQSILDRPCGGLLVAHPDNVRDGEHCARPVQILGRLSGGLDDGNVSIHGVDVSLILGDLPGTRTR